MGISHVHFVQFLSAFAACVTTILWVSPSLQGLRIHKSKSSKNISSIVFILSFCNCVAWLLYGIEKGDLTIIIPNTVGVLVLPFIIFLIFRYR